MGWGRLLGRDLTEGGALQLLGLGGVCLRLVSPLRSDFATMVPPFYFQGCEEQCQGLEDVVMRCPQVLDGLRVVLASAHTRVSQGSLQPSFTQGSSPDQLNLNLCGWGLGISISKANCFPCAAKFESHCKRKLSHHGLLGNNCLEFLNPGECR